MAYAFDKINKYLKTKDESEELFRGQAATRSQTAGTDHDFKSLPPYPGMPGALSTTGGIKGNKFSKAAAGRQAFRSLKGEAGDEIPGFLGGLRSDFDARKESLKKQAEEFRTKTQEETERETSLPTNDSDEEYNEDVKRAQTIENTILSGTNLDNAQLYKRILEGNKKDHTDIEKPTLPPLPKISIPEGKAVSKQAIRDMLRSGKKRYTPGISDFDTKLFYSIPGFSQHVKSLAKDQSALRGELTQLYEETYKKAVEDRKNQYRWAADTIDGVVKQLGANLTQKQSAEADRLKAELKQFYTDTNHSALIELNKIVKDKYKPIGSNRWASNVGAEFGDALDSGSGTLNEEVLRRFYEAGLIKPEDELMQKYLRGDTITQDDWKDAYTARAFGTSGTQSYRVGKGDIDTVDPSHMWSQEEHDQMGRAKALADIKGENELIIPAVGSLGDQSGRVELTLTNQQERESDYPYIRKTLYGEEADITRKYKDVYDDIIKNQGVGNRASTRRFSGLRPFYTYNSLPLYSPKGKLLKEHQTPLLGNNTNPEMSFDHYVRIRGNNANTWLHEEQEKFMPLWGHRGSKKRGGKDDPYSARNESWFRPAMVGNIADEIKKNGWDNQVKNSITVALLQYASNQFSMGNKAGKTYTTVFDTLYNKDKAWKKSMSKMLGAAQGSGYRFDKDTSPEAMQLKKSLGGDWGRAHYSNVDTLPPPVGGVGSNSTYAKLMVFLSHKLSSYSVADLLYQTLAPTTRRNAGNHKLKDGMFDEKSPTFNPKLKKMWNTPGGIVGTDYTNAWVNPAFYKKAYNRDSTVLTPNGARILKEMQVRGGIKDGPYFEALGFKNKNKINMYSDVNIDKAKLPGTSAIKLQGLLKNKRRNFALSPAVLTFMMFGNSAMQQSMGANENYVW